MNLSNKGTQKELVILLERFSDPALRPLLQKAHQHTRDAQVKERKKPGLKRARKAPTYTKR